MAGIEKITELEYVIPSPANLAIIEPKTKWNADTKSAEQVVRDDIPQWSVTVLFVHAGKFLQLTATVSAKTQPLKDVPLNTRVQFTNLVARPYGLAQAGGRVNAGLYFTADSVEVVK